MVEKCQGLEFVEALRVGEGRALLISLFLYSSNFQKFCESFTLSVFDRISSKQRTVYPARSPRYNFKMELPSSLFASTISGSRTMPRKGKPRPKKGRVGVSLPRRGSLAALGARSNTVDNFESLTSRRETAGALRRAWSTVDLPALQTLPSRKRNRSPDGPRGRKSAILIIADDIRNARRRQRRKGEDEEVGEDEEAESSEESEEEEAEEPTHKAIESLLDQLSSSEDGEEEEDEEDSEEAEALEELHKAAMAEESEEAEEDEEEEEEEEEDQGLTIFLALPGVPQPMPKYVRLLPKQKKRYQQNQSLTVVVDLDETLVFARGLEVIIRPHVADLLKRVRALGCELVLWTAGVHEHTHKVLTALDLVAAPNHDVVWFDHLITRSRRWYSEHKPFKDLELLGRQLPRVILIDNNPACASQQPQNSLIVEDYMGAEKDETLTKVGDIVAHLAEVIRADPTQSVETVLSSLSDVVMKRPISVPFARNKSFFVLKDGSTPKRLYGSHIVDGF